MVSKLRIAAIATMLNYCLMAGSGISSCCLENKSESIVISNESEDRQKESCYLNKEIAEKLGYMACISLFTGTFFLARTAEEVRNRYRKKEDY